MVPEYCARNLYRWEKYGGEKMFMKSLVTDYLQKK